MIVSDQEYIRAIAHDWWNLDIKPEPELWEPMWNYIKAHPEEFGELTPQ